MQVSYALPSSHEGILAGAETNGEPEQSIKNLKIKISYGKKKKKKYLDFLSSARGVKWRQFKGVMPD